ncbi:MAG TPA: ATP synthase F0 subunit B [Nitrospirota bacterium]|nr:ATP synthase F0 subunit B [Nitrospirota bacterium]
MTKLRNMASSLAPAMKKTAPRVLSALLFVALTAAAALAAEHGGEEAATMKDWIWRVLNFSIILGVLIYFLAKPLRNFLNKRIKDVEESLAQARSAREEAMKRLSDVEAKLKDKDAELKALLEVAQDNGKKEKELLAQEGGRMTEAILASAKENIDSELIKAKEALRREAALMAVELAEKMVREKIKKEDQERIVREYISKVGG